MVASDAIEVRKTKTGKGLFARQDIKAGERILEFERSYRSKPTRTSLRVDEYVHQDSLDPKAAENFINHSCDPNCWVKFPDLVFCALRPIRAGEELTFDYLTVDWDGEDSFRCKCGALSCRRSLKGFRHLQPEEQLRLRPWLSPFLQKKFAESLTHAFARV